VRFVRFARALGAAGIALLLAAPGHAQQAPAQQTNQLTPAQRQSVANFYRGKVVTLYIGFSVGGGYDIYGRLVARHIGKHIPGQPTVVPVNMEGAGSLKMANWLYNVAPKDGTALGTFSRGVPFEPLIGNAASARFDATKFTWIGSTTNETSVCVTWNRTNIHTFNDTLRHQLIVGGTGSGADADVFPQVIRGVLGARFRLVSGYPGGNDIEFAMERGEVDGRCGWSWSSIQSAKQQWLKDGTIRVLLQLGLEKHPDLPNIPLVMDLARTEEERQIFRLVFVRGALGRPFMAPPGIPAERAAALREAFDKMVNDPAFLAEAKRTRLEITPISGLELTRLLEDVYRTPPHVVAKTRTYLR
jgi:tripartite-type tricarboxylate transporter receptor subunit TctC